MTNMLIVWLFALLIVNGISVVGSINNSDDVDVLINNLVACLGQVEATTIPIDCIRDRLVAEMTFNLSSVAITTSVGLSPCANASSRVSELLYTALPISRTSVLDQCAFGNTFNRSTDEGYVGLICSSLWDLCLCSCYSLNSSLTCQNTCASRYVVCHNSIPLGTPIMATDLMLLVDEIARMTMELSPQIARVCAYTTVVHFATYFGVFPDALPFITCAMPNLLIPGHSFGPSTASLRQCLANQIACQNVTCAGGCVAYLKNTTVDPTPIAHFDDRVSQVDIGTISMFQIIQASYSLVALCSPCTISLSNGWSVAVTGMASISTKWSNDAPVGQYLVSTPAGLFLTGLNITVDRSMVTLLLGSSGTETRFGSVEIIVFNISMVLEDSHTVIVGHTSLTIDTTQTEPILDPLNPSELTSYNMSCPPAPCSYVGITVQTCSTSVCSGLGSREAVQVSTNCDDGNKCTDDFCDEATGVCEHIQRFYTMSSASQCWILVCIDCSLPYTPIGTCLNTTSKRTQPFVPPGVTFDPDLWYATLNGTTENGTTTVFDDTNDCVYYVCNNASGHIDRHNKPNGVRCNVITDVCHVSICHDGFCTPIQDVECFTSPSLPIITSPSTYVTYFVITITTMVFIAGLCFIIVILYSRHPFK